MSTVPEVAVSADGSISVTALKHAMTDERKDLLFLARQAEGAERFEDMCTFMKALCKLAKGMITVEERTVLALSYKHVLTNKRSGYRAMLAPTDNANLGVEYRKQVGNEIKKVCLEFADLVINTILVNGSALRPDTSVLMMKLVGDSYRYITEIDKDKQYIMSAQTYYTDAVAIAEKNLQPYDPIRLSLMLNYGVFCYEILQNVKYACEVTKNTFEKAIRKLDDLDEDDYKDSTLLMQLLRDNLTLWSSSDQQSQQSQKT